MGRSRAERTRARSASRLIGQGSCRRLAARQASERGAAGAPQPLNAASNPASCSSSPLEPATRLVYPQHRHRRLSGQLERPPLGAAAERQAQMGRASARA